MQKTKKLEEKKGLSPTEILGGFLIVGGIILLLVMVSFVFQTLNSNIAKTSGSTINESGWVNATAYQVANVTRSGFASLSVSLVTNASGFVITAGNYTVNTTANTITGGAGAGQTNVSSALISYTFVYDGRDRQVANTSLIGIIAAMPVVLIILVVLAVGAIITILFRSIVMRDSRA